MSTRLSRRGSFVVGLSIVVMLLVSAPVLAFAETPTSPPGNSAAAPGQTVAVPPGQAPDAAPGNSENAPGQATTATGTAASNPASAPGNSGDAPGQNKPGASTPTTTPTTPPGNSGSSNAGGNASPGSATNPNTAGNANAGGNPNAGGSSAAGGTKTDSGGPGGGSSNAGNSAGNGDPAGQPDCDQNDDAVGGAYDATCDGTHQNPGPGKSDNSPGKPADGTVGKADNKNPKGQQPGGNDHNKGYECEPGSTNKGVGKGNPAHTGCTPPPCPGGYSLTVSVIYSNGATGTVSHASGTYATAVTTVTASGTNGSIATPTSQTVAYSNCAGSASVQFTKTENCPNGFSLTVAATSVNGGTGTTSPNVGSHTYGANPPTTVTASGTNGSSASPASQTVTYSNCAGAAQVTFTKTGGGCLSDCGGGCVTDCSTPPPDCDGDGIDDNVDSDISSCKPVPPKKDCDRDGVPDDLDSDMTGCAPIPLCPDGSVMPANGVCNPSVLPDFVLGIRVDRSPVQAAVLPAVVKNPAPAVAASLLPFTGGNLLPFALVSAGLIGAGLPALRRRNSDNR